ncbi:MBL fold metallo-hydrolase [Verrucomicrobia bacterium LW23]|nr:MBL fold metallo-hydrolase [Verrucomicrobia bacterium LW23]
MEWIVEPHNGIFLPQAGLHLDGKLKSPLSFVSHAHSDHIARHKVMLCTPATHQLVAARTSPSRTVIEAEWGNEQDLPGVTAFAWSLHSAGHILGSSQILVRHKDSGSSLLYTGDFKTRAGFSTESTSIPKADVLIMETTFGLRRYRFPPVEAVVRQVSEFCAATLDAGAVPVLLAYSLGKSQEILAGLCGSGFPIMLHESTHRFTEVYARLGVTLAPYSLFDPRQAQGHVVIAPPQALARGSAMALALSRRRSAILSGWALDPGATYRYGCDAAFPLSDHADYQDLMDFVDKVAPRRVYTVHGFVDSFARDLRARGYEAWALGKSNQLEFRF